MVLRAHSDVSQLYVFDWSGTISDDRMPVYTANMKLLEENGKPTMTFEEWLPRTAMTPVEFLANHGVHGDSTELFNRYARYFEGAKKSGIVPTVYPGAREVLQYLRDNNKEIVILSSHPEESLKKESAEYGLEHLFSFMLGSSRDKVQGLMEISRRFCVNPSEILYTGDTIYDVRAGKGAGTRTAAVCNGYHVRQRLEPEKPDLLLETLSELKNGHLVHSFGTSW